MFSLNFIFYVGAFLLAIPAYLVYVLILRPYLLLWHYKRQGIPTIFKPLIGVLQISEEDVIKHGDYFHSLKQQTLGPSRPKALAVTLMDGVQLLLKDPALVKNFNLYQNEYYVKSVEALLLMRALAKDGVVTAEGQTWKRHRKLISVAFSFEVLRDMIPDVYKISNELLDKLKAKDLGKIDMLKEMYTITGDIIGRTFLDQGFSKQTFRGQPIPAYINELIDRLEKENQSLFSFMLPESVFNKGIFPNHRKSLEEIREFRIYIKDLIHQQLVQIEENQRDAIEPSSPISPSKRKSLSLVELFYNQRITNPNEAFTEDDIIDEFIAMILGGTGNPALLLTFASYYFLVNPQCQENVMNEVNALLSDPSNITIEALNQMDYTTAFLKESLRFAPPASLLFLRTAIKDHDLGGLKVKKGTTLNVLYSANNFDPNYHNDPQVFLPERWLDKESKTMINVRADPYVYTPFSAGPRNCIGQSLAMNEVKIILSLFLKKFEYTFTDKDYKMKYDFKFLYQPYDTLFYCLDPK